MPLASPSSGTAHSTTIDHLWLSLLIILLGSFIAPLLFHSATLAIPAIATELSLSAEQVSSFTLLQMLGSVIFVLPAGKLSDKFGRRRIFCLGLLVAGLSSGLAGIGSRALGGVGGALIFASAVALLMSVPPEDQKVRIMGLYISVAYLGTVLGPVFGGLVLESLHWRWVFLLPSLALFTLASLGFLVLRWERYGDRSARIRLLDFLLVMAGGICFAAFCWFQTKRRDPLLQVSLFTQNRTFSILGGSIFLLYVGVMALPFTLTLYFQYLRGIDAKTTGLILLIQALCTACIAPTSGWLSKRFRPRYLIFTGVLLFLIASWLLATLTPNSSIVIVVAALVLLGAGFGIMDAPIMHTSMSTVPESLIGSASATLNGLRTMGGFIGLSFMSFLIAHHLADTDITPAVYPELMTALSQFFMMTAIAATLTIALLMYGVLTRPRQS